jgi:hypothetical protein
MNPTPFASDPTTMARLNAMIDEQGELFGNPQSWPQILDPPVYPGESDIHCLTKCFS